MNIQFKIIRHIFRPIINLSITIALLLTSAFSFVTPIHAREGPLTNQSSIEKAPGESGWLGPVSRSRLQTVNIVFTLIMIGITVASFILWSRLREKIRNLKKVKKELQTQNEFLSLALEGTASGIWDFYPSMRTGFMNKDWYTMFGHTPVEHDVPLSEWRKYVHPDDLAASEKAFFEYLESGGKGHYESEFRIRRADGTWCWVLAKGKAVEWDDAGTPTRITGLHINIEKIKQAQGELAKSEARFRALFRFSPVPLTIISHEGNIIDFNLMLNRVLGYTIEDIYTIDHWWEKAYPDPEYREKAITEWQVSLEQAIAGDITVKPREFNITSKDGSVKTMIIGATVIGNEILVSFFDITERNEAEEKIKASLREKETLLQELYHRTKNNMQVISSMINLSADRIEDIKINNMIKDIDSKIHSMSLVHKKLYESKDLSHINLIDYLKDLTAYLSSFYAPVAEGIEISIQGEELFILIDIAIPLGMVLNELITNAIKYAFPDMKNGSIKINIKRKDEGTIIATVNDNGCGLPAGFTINDNASLGLQIATAITRQQLRGDISFESDSGTTWTVTAKSDMYTERV